MSNRFIAAGLVSLAALLAGCSGKQDAANQSNEIEVVGGGHAQRASPAPVETRGQDFVSAVMSDYDFVLASARAAADKADRAEVKQFATKLGTNIGASRDQLAQIAQASGLKAEAGGSAHGAELAMLSSTRGAPLEKLFVDQQLDLLSELVGLIRAYKNGGDNAELKRWAEANQSVVNDRLLDLQTLKAEIEERAER
jgi:predicted outer membrane protein